MAEPERERPQTLPTAVLAPAAAVPPDSDAGRSRGSGASGGSGTPVRSPSEALHFAEIAQVRMLAAYAMALTTLTGASLPFLGGDTTAKLVHVVGLVIAFTCGAWVVWRLRDPASYQPKVSTILGVCCAFAVVSAFYYWGPLSSAIVAVPMGLYLFAAGQSMSGAYTVYLVCAVPHAVMCIFLAAGSLSWAGMIVPARLSPLEQIAALVIAQFVFAATFVLARRVRRTTFGVIQQLEHAVRTVAQREALLDEAKRELDRALKVGGPGRFTDQEIGSFRLGDVLGRGAMGEVYEARHVGTSQPAAVKLLTHSAGSDPQLVERFLREVRLAASLSCPHVVKVVEVPGEESGIPYLAMEKLVGETLGDRLRRNPKMPIVEAVEMMRQVADGIHAAHEKGVVHRDLKPGNVFRHRPPDVAPDAPVWKVLDFGVSKLVDHGGTLTHGRLVGTPEYMAPEQAKGDSVDARADVYSLGVIAYRALTGRPAFRGNDIPSILYAVTHDMPPCPSSIANVPESMDVILAIALSKDPEERFENAPQLAEALASAAAGNVDAALAERAEEILRAHPWGRAR
jgi:serine/threonine-protein kinase